MALILTSTDLNQLKCSTCNNYASVGPVTRTPVGYNCGRCSDIGSEDTCAFFEILAKECQFPCRYDGNGCTKKLVFGEAVVNHEKICAYRPTSCPVVDDCEWSGSVKRSVEHCLNEHAFGIVEGYNLKFELNLKDSVNKKSVFKIDSDAFLMHLMYSEEMGLSINLRLFIVVDQKDDFFYTLFLRSSDGRNVTRLAKRQINANSLTPIVEWIPSNVLFCLDKQTILATVKVEHDRFNKCDNIVCRKTLPFYVVRCLNNHRFCGTCPTTINQACPNCFASVKNASNYYLMEFNDGMFNCCNAVNDCSFSGNLTELQKHENVCTLVKNIQQAIAKKARQFTFKPHKSFTFTS